MAEQSKTSSSEALLQMTTHPYITNKSMCPVGLDERQMLRVDHGAWSQNKRGNRWLSVNLEKLLDSHPGIYLFSAGYFPEEAEMFSFQF